MTTGETKAAEKAFEVCGVKGMKSKPFRKTFKTQAAFERWMEKNGDDVEIHAFRDLDD